MRRVRAALAGALVLGWTCVGRPALAAEPFDDKEPASAWRDDWPSFSWVEGVATVSAGLATGALALRAPPDEPRWQGGILFDDAVRGAVRLESPDARSAWRRVGDVPYWAAPVLPLLVDPLIVAWAVRGDGKLAFNLTAVSFEAFSYAGLLSFVSTRLSVRERPDASECRRRHPDFEGCEADTEAFWSGHTSIVAASAGLVCANHRYVALWGDPVADAGACALATTGALVTAVTRLMADRHYASDVLVGFGMGFGFGYAVPVVLHYGRARGQARVSFQPAALGDGASLSVTGSF